MYGSVIKIFNFLMVKIHVKKELFTHLISCNSFKLAEVSFFFTL